MSVTNFNRADLALTASTTSVYGPVPTGTVAIAFHGTLSNVDITNRAIHTVTLEIHNGATVVNRLNAIQVGYGSASKVPKMVLKPGDSIFAFADAVTAIALSIEILEVVG